MLEEKAAHYGRTVVKVDDDHSCVPHVGADTPKALVWMITSVDADFTLTSGPTELTDAFRAQATRCLNAVQTA